MSAPTARRVVLVSDDDTLEASLRAVLDDRLSPELDWTLERTTTRELRAALSDSTAACVVCAGTGDATDTIEIVRDAAPECGLMLYPPTPDPTLARESTERETVRYLPQSIDTDDRDLLVDAIEEAIDRERERRERKHGEGGRARGDHRDLLEQTSALADVGGWELDAERGELTWTAETYRLHGVSESFEPTFENAVEFYHPDDRDSVRNDIEAAIAGETFDSVYRFRRADDDLRWVRSRGTPVFEDDAVVGVRGAFQDVTVRKRREEETRQFKRAVEAAGHAIFITEQNGEIRYVNPAFEEITGFDAAEAVGRDPSILKSGEMEQEYYRNLWSTILSGEVWSQPIVNARKSGEQYHASETIAPIVDDGEIEGFVAIQTDVTEQVHTRERLETFREIIHRLDDPIMLQRCDGSFEVVNDAVAEYAGLSKAELAGRDESAFMDDTAAREIDQQKQRVLESERTVTYEVDPAFPTKGQRSFVTTRYPHYSEDGTVDGTVAICRDVTERAEREHQLRVLDRILRHNLYNKMNLILGHAELLEARTDGEVHRSARKIRQTGDELVSLADKERRIVDLLTDDSKPRRFEVDSLVEEVVSECRETHPDQEISVESPPAYAVRAIPEIRDALAELIENAIVHAGETPEVSVSVARTDDRVAITVTDTGPGIPEMERQAAQGAADITPLFHGSGLGLQFVYHAAKRSGGTLRFASPAPEETSGPDGAALADGSVEGDRDDTTIGSVVKLCLPAVDVETFETDDGGADREVVETDSAL